MTRLRLTQIAPWLLPLRKKQRLFCFYAKMRLDGRRYATELSAHPLPEQLFCGQHAALQPADWYANALSG